MRVRFSGKDRTVIDGPFAETKELIAGFWLMQARSLDEVIAWVKRAPNPHEEETEVEIRPVFEAEDFGEESPPSCGSGRSACACGWTASAPRGPEPRVSDAATHRAIEAMWRIESARLTAGLARLTLLDQGRGRCAQLAPSPVVELNRAVAVTMARARRGLYPCRGGLTAG